MAHPFFPDTAFAWIFCLVLVGVTAVAAYTDLRTWKIPKTITLGMLGLGVLFNLARGLWMGAGGEAVWVLGPGGAQFNVPQVYWKAIGYGVDTVMGHTYLWNRPYGRPIYPLGQLYQSPARSEIIRFRKYARAEGARGVSWWDWQEATNTGWKAVGDPLSAFHHGVVKDYATLSQGGGFFDLVLWAQEHLRGAGQSAPRTGVFDGATTRAVKKFQRSNGLKVNGRIDKPTWIALLRYPVARASAARLSAASNGHSMPRAKRYEIPPPALRH